MNGQSSSGCKVRSKLRVLNGQALFALTGTMLFFVSDPSRSEGIRYRCRECNTSMKVENVEYSRFLAGETIQREGSIHGTIADEQRNR